MTDPDQDTGVIPAERVRRLEQPALVDCGGKHESSGQGSLTVVPLIEGSRIAGLEIRCSCGAAAVVECIYPPEETP